MAARLRSVTNFLRELFAITPLPDPPERNTIGDVWAVPDSTYGWAAKDAHYAMGTFDLADDERLVIEGRSPTCAYWGCMLWNPFMQTFDYRYERIGINGDQAVYEPDGSWRLVVASHDPGQPNWLSTTGHRRGVLFFRWFVAAGSSSRTGRQGRTRLTVSGAQRTSSQPPAAASRSMWTLDSADARLAISGSLS